MAYRRKEYFEFIIFLMAKPKIFVSSTYFDLRSVRTELWNFVKSLGYDPVEHERHQIPWGSGERLEQYCYREIAQCQILISILGGRFGSESVGQRGYSISQAEVKVAIELGKQVYIFVDRDVLSEFRTWKINSANDLIDYHSVDNKKIFWFVQEMYELETSNPLIEFDTGEDITTALRELWAGVFHRYLVQDADTTQVQLIKQLRLAVTELTQASTDLRAQAERLRPLPEKILRTASAFPKALRTELELQNDVPDIENWAQLSDYLDKIGFSPTKAPPDVNDNFTAFTNSKLILFISKQLVDESGNILHIPPVEWDPSLMFKRKIFKKASFVIPSKSKSNEA